MQLRWSDGARGFLSRGAGLLFLLGVSTQVLGAPAAAKPLKLSLREQVRAFRAAREAAILREFAGLLAIPNVASDTPNIARNADAIKALLQQRGFAARLLDGQGGPAPVYGELRVPGAQRTLVVYAHYDGQPADAAQWTGDPWAPTLRDKPVEEGGRDVGFAGPFDPEWRLYARGASDDKAPIVGLLTALDALRATRTPLSVNLKVFFEGEEEAGSPHLESVLRANAELLRADLWLLCDGPVHQSRKMQLYFGARGVTGVDVTVYGPLRALHSGHYGNWAPNPAVLLAHLIAGLRDTEGLIRIAGFGDDVRPPTDAERQALASVPDVDALLRRALGLAATEAEGANLAGRILLPALNVRGLAAGHVGDKAANAIPAEASASIDFRLVPDQTPARVRERFEAHLAREGFHVVRETPDLATRLAHPRIVKLAWGPGYPAARTALDLPVSLALRKVVADAGGGPVIAMPTLGGSIPMYLFQDVLKAPVIGLPIANHDNNQHAANENIRLQNLWDGIDVYAGILARLGSAFPR